MSDARVISISEGARSVGFGEGLQWVAGAISDLCKEQALKGPAASQDYATALDDVLKRILAEQERRRNEVAGSQAKG